MSKVLQFMGEISNEHRHPRRGQGKDPTRDITTT